MRVNAKPAADDEQLFISFGVAVIDPDAPDKGGPYEGVLNLNYVQEDQEIAALGEWYAWQMPDTAPALKPGSRYRIFVTATCVLKAASDDRSDSHMAIADIKTLATSDTLAVQRELSTLGDATAETWSDRLSILEQYGLWFDYLTELQTAIDANYPGAYNQWATAMGDIGLPVPSQVPATVPDLEAVPVAPDEGPVDGAGGP